MCTSLSHEYVHMNTIIAKKVHYCISNVHSKNTVIQIAFKFNFFPVLLFVLKRIQFQEKQWSVGFILLHYTTETSNQSQTHS